MVGRLEATLEEMSASLHALDKIVLAGGGERAEVAKTSSALVLIDEEKFWQVDQVQVEQAQAQLPKLRQSLETWLASTRLDHDS